MNFETVIGLEVHVELLTKTKVFCSCASEFAGAPNTRICEICTGMPGALPSLNRKVVEFAVRTGLATDCEIREITRFDRKNYFYPDLPKAYQISQLYLPICRNGHVDIETKDGMKRIGIHEIHIEEDAGKLIHTQTQTLIDYNRCGVPLLEIVSEPDFRNAQQVVAYLEALRRMLTYIGVSDCKMQEGSMRADVNLSVRKEGDENYGTRTEMKNLNSLRDIADAIESESKRQIALIESGKKVVRQTRRWDADARTSVALRSKEDENDYRYFPEPDIPAVKLSGELLSMTLPELPAAKKTRYVREYGLSEYDADVLTEDFSIASFFEQTVALGASPKAAANMIMGEVLRLLKESSTDASDNPLKARALADIIAMIESQRISRTTGKQVLEMAFCEGIDPERYVREHSLMQITDESAIRDACERAIANNAKSVADYKGGKQTALTYLIGQTMKLLGGKADAARVREILCELLA